MRCWYRQPRLITSKCLEYSNVKVRKHQSKIFCMPLKGLFDKCLNSRIFKFSVTLFKQALTNIKHKKMPKNLAVFDFDHTIINDNSDTAVMNLIDHSKIPKEIKQLHKSDGWTAFMQGIFNTLHEHDVKEESIRDLIKTLPAVEGMPELIKEINENLNFDVIVISDSNLYFIDLWLEATGLKKHVLKVFTNPARFENGLLKIEMYHLQDYCRLSTKNLCKGQIMEDFIKERQEEGVVYDRVLYCGDGMNDFCPILRLRENDLVCVRYKYKCMEMVTKAKEGQLIDADGVVRVVKSEVCIWKDGFEIIECINQRSQKNI